MRHSTGTCSSFGTTLTSHQCFTSISLVPLSFNHLSLVGHFVSMVSSECFITDLSGLGDQLLRIILCFSAKALSILVRLFHSNTSLFPLQCLPRHSLVILRGTFSYKSGSAMLLVIGNSIVFFNIFEIENKNKKNKVTLFITQVLPCYTRILSSQQRICGG